MFFKILIQIITIYRNDTVRLAIHGFLTDEQNNSGLYLITVLLDLPIIHEVLLVIQQVQ